MQRKIERRTATTEIAKTAIKQEEYNIPCITSQFGMFSKLYWTAG
jgi:hypothetical protein